MRVRLSTVQARFKRCEVISRPEHDARIDIRLRATRPHLLSHSDALIGSESVEHFVFEAYEVIGLENDMRSYVLGPKASTEGSAEPALTN